MYISLFWRSIKLFKTCIYISHLAYLTYRMSQWSSLIGTISAFCCWCQTPWNLYRIRLSASILLTRFDGIKNWYIPTFAIIKKYENLLLSKDTISFDNLVCNSVFHHYLKYKSHLPNKSLTSIYIADIFWVFNWSF